MKDRIERLGHIAPWHRSPVWIVQVYSSGISKRFPNWRRIRVIGKYKTIIPEAKQVRKQTADFIRYARKNGLSPDDVLRGAIERMNGPGDAVRIDIEAELKKFCSLECLPGRA